MKKIFGWLLLVLAWPAMAQTLPKIAVTDLNYEEKVSRYFEYTKYEEKTKASHSSRYRERDSDYSSSASASERSRLDQNIKYEHAAGFVEYIDRGELRKFTADIKGEMLKSGSYRVSQAKPYTAKNTEKLYDIIDRIKKGMYPGADYVLFGTINNIEFRQENNPIQGSNATSVGLALELVAEFSLINTRTYEVKAAFSAMGEGSDIRLVNAVGQSVHLNRSKVMYEVAKSLGVDVARQLEAQFDPTAGRHDRGHHNQRVERREETVIIYK